MSDAVINPTKSVAKQKVMAWNVSRINRIRNSQLHAERVEPVGDCDIEAWNVERKAYSNSDARTCDPALHREWMLINRPTSGLTSMLDSMCVDCSGNAVVAPSIYIERLTSELHPRTTFDGQIYVPPSSRFFPGHTFLLEIKCRPSVSSPLSASFGSVQAYRRRRLI